MPIWAYLMAKLWSIPKARYQLSRGDVYLSPTIDKAAASCALPTTPLRSSAAPPIS